MTYRSLIENQMVDSNLPIIVYGSVRGLVSKHQSAPAATKSLTRDQNGCRRQGGYSDANVYRWENDRWEELR